jgi:5'-3' exonuclease
VAISAYFIDLPIVFFRHYFSEHPALICRQGHDVYALVATLRWLDKNRYALRGAEYVYCGLDESLGSGFRHRIDEHYKANRALPSDDIIFQFSLLKELIPALGMGLGTGPEFEADDYLASINQQFNQRYPHKISAIVTRDKDLRQLLNPQTLLLDPFTLETLDEHSCTAQMGFPAQRMALYLALLGDRSDNIRGIPKIGVKTAAQLVAHCGNVAQLQGYALSADLLGLRGEVQIKQQLRDSAACIEHNLQLTQVRYDALAEQDFIPLKMDVAFVQALINELDITRSLASFIKNLTE